jgi:hypothetical protein
MDHAGDDDIIGELLSCSDFQTTYAVLTMAANHLSHSKLENVFGLSVNEDRFESLLEIARRRHGALADMIALSSLMSIEENRI